MSAERGADGNPGAFAALGFGTTVAMWAAGYFFRLPAVHAPGWLMIMIMAACIFGGGALTGRFLAGGPPAGARTGLIASLLNLLILGSVFGADEGSGIRSAAAIWIPCSLLFGMILGAAGAMMTSRGPCRAEPRWTPLLAFVAAAATFLLIIAGGVVTSSESGLAVVDWPNSFGHNMFLFPLAQMSGGIYYEHAHRLLGSLVGLTTLTLCIHLWRTDRRKGMKLYALAALLFVAAQGILGGMRVTGQPTLSTSPAYMSPSTTLAMLHGVMGQLFLGLLVSIGIMTSAKWIGRATPATFATLRTDRRLTVALFIVLIAQIAFGAVVRHFAWLLIAHVSTAMVVLTWATLTGMRTSRNYAGVPEVRKMGSAVVGITAVQVLLGFIALAATGVYPPPGPPSTANVVLTTAHQAFGAFLLAHVVMLLCWLYRLVEPERAGFTTIVPKGRKEAHDSLHQE